MMRLVGDGDSLETTWNHRPASDFLPEDELGRMVSAGSVGGRERVPNHRNGLEAPRACHECR